MMTKILQFGNLLGKLILMNVLFLSLSFGQNLDSTNVTNGQYTKALQIGFLNEAALYYHCYIGSAIYLRTGFDFNWNYDEKKDGEGYYRYKYSSYYYPSDIEEKYKLKDYANSYDLTFSSLLLFKLNNYEYATIFVGAGPSLSYSYSKNVQDYQRYTDTSKYSNNYETAGKVFGIGPIALIGIRSHIYRSIYIISEYTLSGYYTWNTNDSESYFYDKSSPQSTPYSSSYQRHSETNGWKIRFSKVKIGLMIEL